MKTWREIAFRSGHRHIEFRGGICRIFSGYSDRVITYENNASADWRVGNGNKI